MTHVLAFSEEVGGTFICKVFVLVSIRLRDVQIRFLLASFDVLFASCGLALTSEVVVRIVIESCVSLVSAEAVEVLPFTEAVVVVDCDFVFQDRKSVV